jgi:hypothetical protein
LVWRPLKNSEIIDMKNYLPSKPFIIFIAIIAGGAVLFFGGSYLFSKKQEVTKSSSPIALQTSVLEDLFNKDTDGDGLKDWEEVLWGTDPKNPKTFDGLPDALWVESRQKELEGKNKIAFGSEENMTERFSVELYAFLAALEAENIDSTTVYDLSAALGEQIFATDLPDYFKQVKTGAVAEEIYLENLATALERTGLGNELALVDAIVAGEKNAGQIEASSADYKKLGEELSGLVVPAHLASFHLGLINDIYKIGLSLGSIAKTNNDPIVGLIGLAQYQKYSDSLEERFDSLTII